MTELRYRTAIAATTAALLLTGCTGTSGATPPTASATASPRPAAEASPTRAHKSLAQVLRDIHDAAQGVGDDRMRVLSDEKTVTDELPHCNAHGLIMTLELPGRPEILRLTDRLHNRGWKADGPVTDLAELRYATWGIMLRARPVPKELTAKAAPHKGMIQVAVIGKCTK
ncbi:hypothetical protein ACISU4_25925 [Streptomyces wuyuanensis]|uniref:hypothetical protein n=1 Tax=Streptomyces wuyuanensis TaxID=1196353 RepID=UPI00381A191D